MIANSDASKPEPEPNEEDSTTPDRALELIKRLRDKVAAQAAGAAEAKRAADAAQREERPTPDVARELAEYLLFHAVVEKRDDDPLPGFPRESPRVELLPEATRQRGERVLRHQRR